MGVPQKEKEIEESLTQQESKVMQVVETVHSFIFINMLSSPELSKGKSILSFGEGSGREEAGDGASGNRKIK